MKLRNTLDLLADLTYIDQFDVSRILDLIRTVCEDGLRTYTEDDQEDSPIEALINQMQVGDGEKASQDFAWLSKVCSLIGGRLGLDFVCYEDSISRKPEPRHGGDDGSVRVEPEFKDGQSETELVSVKTELENQVSDLDKEKEELNNQINQLRKNINNSNLMIQTMKDELRMKTMEMDDAQKKIMELAKAHSALH